MIDGRLSQPTAHTGDGDGLATLAWLTTTATMLGIASILVSRVLAYLI